MTASGGRSSSKRMTGAPPRTTPLQRLRKPVPAVTETNAISIPVIWSSRSMIRTYNHTELLGARTAPVHRMMCKYAANTTAPIPCLQVFADCSDGEHCCHRLRGRTLLESPLRR